MLEHDMQQSTSPKEYEDTLVHISPVVNREESADIRDTGTGKNKTTQHSTRQNAALGSLCSNMAHTNQPPGQGGRGFLAVLPHTDNEIMETI